MGLVKKIDLNSKGKLFVVGDIHGCYTLLMNTLNSVKFDFENDLLVSVGDLVDRGSENLKCVELLSEKWFVAIRGNHEDLCINGLGDDSYKRCHISNGGEWFYELDELAQYNIAKSFSELPIAMEIKFNNKIYGFVHGHVDQNNWIDFKNSLEEKTNHVFTRDPAELAMWGRERLNPDAKQYSEIVGVDKVFFGHTVVRNVCKRDNCYFIDIGSCFTGRLAVLDVEVI